MVAATNRNLNEAISKREFREDLFHRLNVFPVKIPPLRDRREEIPFLAAYFANRFAGELGWPVPSLSPEGLRRFQEYPWPGNVRELEAHDAAGGDRVPESCLATRGCIPG